MSTGPAPAPTRGVPVVLGAPGPAERGGPLTGTGQLLRLALRRDRVLLPGWVLGISAMAYFSAAATVGLYPDVAQRIQAAEAVNGSAALVALYGRIHDPTSLGELSLFKLTAFGAAMIGVLMVIMAVRHTRGEEEAGRLELVGAGVVGRAAPLAAALIVAGIGCVGIAVLTAGGLAMAGLPAVGSLAFGAAWGATGVFFAAVGALAAQLTTTGRAATGVGLIVLAVAYAARAVGDLAEAGPGWLSWLSPIGWNQQVRAFSGTRWAILVLPLLATAVLAPVAFWLRSRRDLGAGLIADGPGPARGRIGSPVGLAWRLQRNALLGWALAASLMGLVLGSVATNVGGFLDSPQMQQFLERLGGRQGLVQAFLAAEVGLIGALLTAYGIVAVNWLHGEEDSGRLENLLATATARLRWAVSHVGCALVSVAVLMLLAGLAIGLGDAAAEGSAARIGPLLLAAAGRIPAAWVVVGIAVAVWGQWPRLQWVAWLAFTTFLVLGEFGALWELPDWARDLSPFAHAPIAPGPNPDYSGIPWLTAAAVLLVGLGLWRFTRRDVQGT